MKNKLWSYKTRMQFKVFNSIALCVGLFLALYIPKEISGPISEKLTDMQAIALKLGIGTPIALLLQWVIFAQDHLANGSSVAAKFFRHYYPSHYANHKYSLTIPAATRLWFNLYNQWHLPENPNHNKYKTNSNRTYSLRMIFLLTRVFVIFAVLASIMTVGCFWPLKEAEFSKLLPSRIAGIIFASVVAIWLYCSNSIKIMSGGNYYEKYEVTGAYHKYKEYQGILWEEFEEAVLSTSQNTKGERR